MPQLRGISTPTGCTALTVALLGLPSFDPSALNPPKTGFVLTPRTGNGLLERTPHTMDDTGPHTMDVDTWPQQSPEPGVSGLTMSFVKRKWELWHQFKKFQPCSSFTVFRCWLQITQFAKIKRSQAKLVKQAKQQKFDAVLQEADEAARHYDLWRLRRLIDPIIPKNRRTRIQLRTSTGGLADPVTSHEMMCRFVQETWNPMRLHHPESLRLQPWHCAPGVPFTKDQLTQALSQLPANKAVAYCFAPTIILKEQASAIADLLFPNLCNWWQQFPPKMPQHWRDGWMVLLPKPGKKADRCAHLRPLALAEPCGKAITGLLTQVAQTQILHKLCTVPQFGYMPQRSTFDAIRRVTQHVAQVQQLIYAQRFKLHNHRDSIASLPCHGGLQVYLDLSKAFDSVDRDTLWSALRNIGVSHDVLTLLEFLRLGSQYHVTNGQLSAQLLVTKGVRQGCKAAPLLWTLLVYELFQQLQRTTGQQWLRDFVTAFADDFNIACPIHCSADLDKHLRCIGQLLDLLKSFGLKVNPEKCTVLLTLRGSASKAVLQQHTCWHHDKRHLNIPCADGDTQMPIDTTAQYLGVTISYTSTAALTMQQRLKQAVKCFGRLRCWLRSTSKVNMQARFQLWKRTVVPTLTYGLGATGLTTHGIVAMCTEIHRQLRVIAGDHAYRTHNTNQV